MKLRKLLAAVAAAAVAVSTMALSAFAADIWSGSNDLGTDWNGDNALKLDASLFADAKGGDNVTITYTTNEESGMSLKIVENTNGWPALSSPEGLDPQWETVYVEAGTTSYSFAISAEDVTRVQTSGMVIQGWGVTLTKVSVGDDTAADSAVVDDTANDDADADIVDTDDDADDDAAEDTASANDTAADTATADTSAPAADTTTTAAATGNVAVASVAAVMAVASAAAVVSKKRK